MASAEECREALQALTNRLGEMDPQARASYFSNRSFSCHVTDLGVTFITRITEHGAEPVKEAAPDEPPVPRLLPIVRSTIRTWRYRHS